MIINELNQDKGFVKVPRAIINGDLTLAEIGLIVKLLGLSPDWKFSIMGIASVTKAGRDQISNLIRQLEVKGYLERVQSKDKTGRYIPGDIYIRIPTPEKPSTEKPSTEKPSSENSAVLKIITTQDTTNINNKDLRVIFTPPSVTDIKDYCNKNSYTNVDGDKFFNYYSQRSWRDKGNNPIGDWHKKVREWNDRGPQYNNKPTKVKKAVEDDVDWNALGNSLKN